MGKTDRKSTKFTSFDIKFTVLVLENACYKLDINRHSPSILYISFYTINYKGCDQTAKTGLPL